MLKINLILLILIFIYFKCFNTFTLQSQNDDKFSIEHYKHHNITDEVPVVDSNDNEIQSIHLRGHSNGNRTKLNSTEHHHPHHKRNHTNIDRNVSIDNSTILTVFKPNKSLISNPSVNTHIKPTVTNVVNKKPTPYYDYEYYDYNEDDYYYDENYYDYDDYLYYTNQVANQNKNKIYNMKPIKKPQLHHNPSINLAARKDYHSYDQYYGSLDYYEQMRNMLNSLRLNRLNRY